MALIEQADIRILADGRPDLRRQSDYWDKEPTETLIELWKGDLPSRDIAKALNKQFGTSFTKNAILGKVHRLNLPMRGQSFQYRNLTDEEKQNRKRKREATYRERQRQSSTHVRRQGKPRLFLVTPAAIVDLEIPVEQRKQLAQLDNCHCRWPVGESGTKEFFFCGAPEADMHRGRPYCLSHQFRSMSHAA